MRKHLLLAASLLTLAGCAARQPVSAERFAMATEVKQDGFSKTTSTIGPRYMNGGAALRLGSVRLSNGAMVYALYVETYRRDWLFPTHIYDRDGNRLEATRQSWRVGVCSSTLGCENIETALVTLPEAYLRANMETGMDFQLYGKGKEGPFMLPPTYIQGFLASVPAR